MQKKYIVTVSDAPIGEPFTGGMYTRQYANDTDKAVELFVEYCQSLDVGCVQLWSLIENTGHYFENGKLYI